MRLPLSKIHFIAALCLGLSGNAGAEDAPDRIKPARGFCIAALEPKNLDAFVALISKELVPRHVDTLILRVDYDYQYDYYPELRGGWTFSSTLPAREVTFTGVARFLRRRRKDVRADLSEPATAAGPAGRRVTNPSHKIHGGGYSIGRVVAVGSSLATDYVQVSDQEAMLGVRILAAES